MSKPKKNSLEQKSLRARYTNSQGQVISLHHAFKTIRFGAVSKLSVFVLPVVFSLIVWLWFGPITAVWDQIFQFWTHALYADGAVTYRTMHVLGQYINVPYPALGAGYPSLLAVWFNVLICAIIFWVSLFMPQGSMPFIYLLRAAILIQFSASIFFLLSPNFFPYDIGAYVTDALALGLYLMFLIPIIFAAVFYIFDFPLWWKMVMTILTLTFYVIALPHQFMLHAYIINALTYLFLPLMYFLFGTLMNILMFVAFYSIGMSYRPARKNDLGRFA